MYRRSAHSCTAERGFTLVEIMVAMSISIVALLANLFLFNTASKDLAAARSLTDATNLAMEKIADFRSKTIAQIQAETPYLPGGTPPVLRGQTGTTLPVQSLCIPSSVNPLLRRWGRETNCPDCAYADCESSTCPVEAIFTRTWLVTAVDLDHHGTPNNECDDTPDMCTDALNMVSCDVVNVSLDVSWTQADKVHHVTMTTFVTGVTP
jgi:prepilin-type N-terminal cleavage/methylation domain-containing protein